MKGSLAKRRSSKKPKIDEESKEAGSFKEKDGTKVRKSKSKKKDKDGVSRSSKASKVSKKDKREKKKMMQEELMKGEHVE
jgi:hypothetical protein